MGSYTLEIKQSEENSVKATLNLNGDLTIDNLSNLKLQFEEALQMYDELKLCISNVEAMDVPFVQLIQSMHFTVRQAGKQLVVDTELDQNLKTSFESSGFAGILNIK